MFFLFLLPQIVFLLLLFTEQTKNNHHRDFHNYLAGSTDFGNVSYEVPGIHPFFYIGTDALNHTEEYTEAAGTAACVYSEQMLSALMKLELHQMIIKRFRPSPLSRSLSLSVWFSIYSLPFFFFLCQELRRPSCSPWGQPKPWLWQLWTSCAALLCYSKWGRTSGSPNWSWRND